MKTPQSLWVDNLGDSGIDIRILGKTRALKQWEVGGLRKRIKKVTVFGGNPRRDLYAVQTGGLTIAWVKEKKGGRTLSGGERCFVS